MRRTPPRVVEALAAAGLLQMFLPRSLGGAELPPLAAFHAIEELSKADGSVGWCTMIATVLSQFTGWLDPAVARTMAGTPADFRAAGSLRPQGTGTRGRWRLSCLRPVELRQRRHLCEVAVLHLPGDGRRRATADAGRCPADPRRLDTGHDRRGSRTRGRWSACGQPAAMTSSSTTCSWTRHSPRRSPSLRSSRAGSTARVCSS